MEFWLPDEFQNLPPEMQEPPAEEFGMLPPEDVLFPEQATPPEEFTEPGATGEQPDGETPTKPFSRLVKKWLYFCAAAIILTAAGHSEYVRLLYAGENSLFSDLGERAIEVSETVSEQIGGNAAGAEVFPLADEKIQISVYLVMPISDSNGRIRLMDEKTVSAETFDSFVLPEATLQGRVLSDVEYVMLLFPDEGMTAERRTETIRVDRTLTREDVERVPVSSDGVRHIVIYAEPVRGEG